MDKKINHLARREEKINSTLYKDHDESRQTFVHVRHQINEVHNQLLKADKKFDRKHKG